MNKFEEIANGVIAAINVLIVLMTAAAVFVAFSIVSVLLLLWQARIPIAIGLLVFFLGRELKGQSSRSEHLGRARVEEKGTEARAHIGVVATVINPLDPTSPSGSDRTVAWRVETKTETDPKTGSTRQVVIISPEAL